MSEQQVVFSVLGIISAGVIGYVVFLVRRMKSLERDDS